MSINIKNVNWLNITELFVKTNNVFNRVTHGYIKVNNIWKLIYQYLVDSIGVNLYQSYNILLSGTDTIVESFEVQQSYIVLLSTDAVIGEFNIYQSYLIQEDT